MARLARVVAPGEPHHVVQRGNRRMPTFFREDDYRLYFRLLAEWCGRHNVAVWAYCLMPNHVHCIAVPQEPDGLRKAVGEAHRRYTAHINTREGWTGHLWQGRFSSCAMDRAYCLAAARYIERNPVRAGLCAEPGDYPWSSAAAHLAGRDDGLVRVEPLLSMMEDWAAFLGRPEDGQEAERLRRHTATGRPLGPADFLHRLEQAVGRDLTPGRPGRRRKAAR